MAVTVPACAKTVLLDAAIAAAVSLRSLKVCAPDSAPAFSSANLAAWATVNAPVSLFPEASEYDLAPGNAALASAKSRPCVTLYIAGTGIGGVEPPPEAAAASPPKPIPAQTSPLTPAAAGGTTAAAISGAALAIGAACATTTPSTMEFVATISAALSDTITSASSSCSLISRAFALAFILLSAFGIAPSCKLALIFLLFTFACVMPTPGEN